MTLNISFNVHGSLCSQNRVFFDSFNATNDRSLETGRAGVRSYSRCYGWLLSIIGKSVAVRYIDTDSKARFLYLNKNSLHSWFKRHSLMPKIGMIYAEQINKVCLGEEYIPKHSFKVPPTVLHVSYRRVRPTVLNVSFRVQSRIFGQNRAFFGPFDAKNDIAPLTRRAGVRSHIKPIGWLLSIIGKAVAVRYKTGQGSSLRFRNLYLNKNSLDSWFRRHYVDPTEKMVYDMKISDMEINKVCSLQRFERSRLMLRACHLISVKPKRFTLPKVPPANADMESARAAMNEKEKELEVAQQAYDTLQEQAPKPVAEKESFAGQWRKRLKLQKQAATPVAENESFDGQWGKRFKLESDEWRKCSQWMEQAADQTAKLAEAEQISSAYCFAFAKHLNGPEKTGIESSAKKTQMKAEKHLKDAQNKKIEAQNLLKTADDKLHLYKTLRRTLRFMQSLPPLFHGLLHPKIKEPVQEETVPAQMSKEKQCALQLLKSAVDTYFQEGEISINFKDKIFGSDHWIVENTGTELRTKLEESDNADSRNKVDAYQRYIDAKKNLFPVDVVTKGNHEILFLNPEMMEKWVTEVFENHTHVTMQTLFKQEDEEWGNNTYTYTVPADEVSKLQDGEFEPDTDLPIVLKRKNAPQAKTEGLEVTFKLAPKKPICVVQPYWKRMEAYLAAITREYLRSEEIQKWINDQECDAIEIEKYFKQGFLAQFFLNYGYDAVMINDEIFVCDPSIVTTVMERG